MSTDENAFSSVDFYLPIFLSNYIYRFFHWIVVFRIFIVKMNMDKIMNFLGSLLVLALAVGIFLMLMDKEMPDSNRELLISFVSVLFGAMATSLGKITGNESETIGELTRKNKELEEKIKNLTPNE